MTGDPGVQWQRRFFLAITLTIPVMFFVLLELGLRMAGFGQSWPLFIPATEAPDYLRPNPDVIRRFVVGQSNVPDVSIRPVPFPANKATGTFRIFVQGGSTAAGFPYGFGASPAGMLQQRLQQTFSERDIEVITTAMTAVNSYTLLDFAEEIIAQQPDIVVIYAGHNEYLGFLGVGSTYSAGSTRAAVLTYLALRELRIFQLLERAWQALNDHTDSETAEQDTNRTLMARVVREPHIPIDSPLYRRGLEQFRANVSGLLERYREAGIPVFIGTLVSNEGDQEPFANGLAADTDTERWQRLYESGRSAFRSGQMDEAEAALNSAIALDDTAADAWFVLGAVLDAQGEYARARDAFLAAKDRDQLRFRAPEVFNAVIREVATEYGATVVEVQSALVNASKRGIVGDGLMLEHLHPNLRGYFLMADAYYDAMRAAGLIGAWEHPISDDEAWNDVPVTRIDRLNARYQVQRLKSDWPFEEPGHRIRVRSSSGYVEQLAYRLFKGYRPWPDATRDLLQHLRLKHYYEEAAHVATILADAFPYDVAAQLTAAKLTADTGDGRDRPRLLWRAARGQAAAGDTQAARDNLEQLLALAPEHAQARRLLYSLGDGSQ